MDAPATREAYASDTRLFDAWCAQHGHTMVTPEIVAAYFKHLRSRGLKGASFGRKQAAFLRRMRQQGITHEEVARVRQAGRDARHGRNTTKATTPLLLDAVQAMLAVCPSTLIGLRDRALIAVAFITGLRCGELSALTVEDLTPTNDGGFLILRRSTGEILTLLPEDAALSARALRAWLDAAGHVRGPVFRPVALGGGGRVGEATLSGNGIKWIVKKCAEEAGLDPALYSPRSLRAGRRLQAAIDGAAALARRRRC
jgi:site-specific recombinase XerD